MPQPADHALPFLLLGAFRGLVDELHRRLAAAGFPGVTARHGFALQAVGTGCTAAELAQRLGVSRQASSKTVEVLLAEGWVRRSPNPADRREWLITRTDRAEAMLAESGHIVTALVGQWRATAGDQSVDTTLRTLARVDHGPRSGLDLSDWL